jgi:hypothetical protein
MPIYSVPLIETDPASRDPRYDPVMKIITANSEAEAADLAEVQNPGYTALRDEIEIKYHWTFRQ